MSSDTESFFGVFEYACMETQAIDCGLVFENCEIEKDITTKSGIFLCKGVQYDAVWFLLNKAEFRFIHWIPENGDREHDDFKENPATLVVIPQSELAEFLYW